MRINAIDLFSGMGGLSWGLEQAGFNVVASVEIDERAAKVYKLNHQNTEVLIEDIRAVDAASIKKHLYGESLHLLAGCPPCQGFSSIRRRNKKRSVNDNRNQLILEFLRLVMDLTPMTIMFENVPGITNYYLYKKMIRELELQGYYLDADVVNVKDYGVPQRRKRLVLVGSLFGEIRISRGENDFVSVRDAIGNLPSPDESTDAAHKIIAKHRTRTQEMINSIPKNGGSRKDIPEYTLECHKKENIGFNDVYGRLRWDDFSSTITGGCLNPSKGRFLHPEENRCISAREAALLQSFPIDYIIPSDIPKDDIARFIGNALPPKFSKIQAENIKEHLATYIGEK